ncbi:hypothetical protein SODALDRAFT_327945 [Sodiomyces alkalinus F11]|uniref:Involucrin repeat protein n=1 Tax=Sodiomyces alkalinus (strain CBS 110278 / VKM F-3762 / F11) TaxID=1314773 RepID=A0A3N2QAF5_SODAK|nr:hypothetical protein SODALDRAFT_327945 [Sodiomyces alkalinus F11]ROT43731.1 hypothetical protein SODALDRAFT_327945 [Sodiomyces alkalinus F11]
MASPPGAGTAKNSDCGSATHVLITSSVPSPPSSTGQDVNNVAIIAPPPRAQLGCSNATSGPSTDDRGFVEGSSHNNNNEHGLKERENSPPTGRDSRRPDSKSSGGGSGSGSGPAKPTSASAAATAALLRDKDQRIGQLERELGVMETEFSRQLERLAHAECDAATAWQGRLAAVEGELGFLGAEAEALRRQVAEKERESVGLRAQVRGLKAFVSSSTRTDGQAATSDEVFGDGMAKLGNGLQNWVIVHFRRAKIDLSSADDEVRYEVERLVPMCEELVFTAKVHFLLSLVSRVLVDMVFDSYYVGLTKDQARGFRYVEQTLLSYGSQETLNQWRSSTLSLLRREGDIKMQEETEAVIQGVITRLNRILDGIADVKSTESRDQALRVQVVSAIELSRLLAVQKAVFDIHMPEILPHQETMFDGSTMEDIGGEDEETLSRRDICCVTFPGIIKRGDETGGHLQYRNVIAKARVLCSPE